jgi:hypothetical protein
MNDLNQNQTRKKVYDCALDKIRAHPENASKSVDHILFNNILPTIDSTGRVDERIVRTNTTGQWAQREKTLERSAQVYSGSFGSFLLFLTTKRYGA